MNSLEDFADHLIQAKGLGNLDAKILNEMRSDLLERIGTRINMIIVDHMPQSQRAAFEQLMDSGASDEVVQAFCAGAIPNLSELTAMELASFKEKYLGSHNKSPSSLSD